MLMQRSLPPRFDQVGERVAAVQRGFPEAVVQHREIGRNPNRPFAAPASDVSQADLVSFRCACANVSISSGAKKGPSLRETKMYERCHLLLFSNNGINFNFDQPLRFHKSGHGHDRIDRTGIYAELLSRFNGLLPVLDICQDDPRADDISQT